MAKFQAMDIKLCKKHKNFAKQGPGILNRSATDGVIKQKTIYMKFKIYKWRYENEHFEKNARFAEENLLLLDMNILEQKTLLE